MRTLKVVLPNFPAVGVRDTSWVVGKRSAEGGNIGGEA